MIATLTFNELISLLLSLSIYIIISRADNWRGKSKQLKIQGKKANQVYASREFIFQSHTFNFIFC